MRIAIVTLLFVRTSAFLSSPRHNQLLTTRRWSSVESNENQSNNKQEESESPWASSEWTFTLNFGREAGSMMPEEWGSSGGRLVVNVPMEITSDRPSSPSSSSSPLPSFLQGDQKPDLDPMLQKNSFQMNCLSSSSPYVTMEGEQQCTFDSQGGWKIRLPSGNAQGLCGKLMAYLDLTSTIQKNDVRLEKGERIYLTAKCWREEELERALKQLKPVHAKYRQTQQRLNDALEHETGDRRLDGTDPIQTVIGMKDTAQLVIQRDEALRQYQEANRVFPTIDETVDMVPTAEELEWQEGPWVSKLPTNLICFRRCFYPNHFSHFSKTHATF